MTNHHTPNNRRRDWLSNLNWALIGAVVGNLLTAPMDEARLWAHEQWTHGRQFLAEGKALRLGAIQQQSEDQHKAANAAFEQSEAGDVAEATAFLGQAYCYGWGVPLDRRRGFRMILGAVMRDGRLAVPWLDNPDMCPEKDPSPYPLPMWGEG